MKEDREGINTYLEIQSFIHVYVHVQTYGQASCSIDPSDEPFQFESLSSMLITFAILNCSGVDLRDQLSSCYYGNMLADLLCLQLELS